MSGADKVSRRDILKVGGLAAAAALVELKTGLFSAMFGSVKDKVLSSDLYWETTPPIHSLDQGAKRILEGLKILPGIDYSKVIISDQGGAKKVWVNTEDPDFVPASVLKVAICEEAWKIRPDLLTPEMATKILKVSESSADLFMSLPQAEGRTISDRDVIIKDLLSDTGADVVSPRGEMSLKVNLESYFAYLHDSDFPDVMLSAMRQTSADASQSKVAQVLSTFVDLDTTPVYFKLGLDSVPGSLGDEPLVSYFFRVGDINVLGYVVGTDQQSALNQLYSVAAVVGSYASNKSGMSSK